MLFWTMRGASMADRITISLWLHREEADAWLCSRGGVGAGVYLPKSEISIEPGHPVPDFGPVGPVKVDVPRWLAEREGLVRTDDVNQGALF